VRENGGNEGGGREWLFGFLSGDLVVRDRSCTGPRPTNPIVILRERGDPFCGLGLGCQRASPQVKMDFPPCGNDSGNEELTVGVGGNDGGWVEASRRRGWTQSSSSASRQSFPGGPRSSRQQRLLISPPPSRTSAASSLLQNARVQLGIPGQFAFFIQRPHFLRVTCLQKNSSGVAYWP